VLLSIRKIFTNLKLALLILTLGTLLLTFQLFQITSYSERLGELKKLHLLIDKTTNIKLTDPKMASILINSSLSEITLSVKLSIANSWMPLHEQNTSLSHSLEVSSQAFCDNALIWSESLPIALDSNHARMMNARNDFLRSIDQMIDEQINTLDASVSTAIITALILSIIGALVFVFYRSRLNQIYTDIDIACSIDTTGEPKTVRTQEIDFILKRLVRRSMQPSSACSGLINPSSGLNNLKGLMTVFNGKKSARASNTIFLAVFEVDQYASTVNSLSKEDSSNLFKKLGEIIALHEQPLDITAHLDDDHIVYLMSRNSKQIALEDCEKILHTVEVSGFSTAKGVIKITLSGGFLLKIPVKSIDEAIEDALQLVNKAKEGGGNRIAQLRDRADSYR
jgi:GGDEF domain-containing protein